MVKSRFSDVVIPEIPVHDLVFSVCAMYGDKIAMVDAPTGKSYTYTEVVDISRKISSGLARLGIKKGDVIGFFMPNHTTYILMYYGVLGAGGTMTSCNPIYTAYEVGRQMKDANAKYLFTSPSLLDRAREAAKQSGTVQGIIVEGDFAGTIPYSRLASDDGSMYPSDIQYDVKNDLAVLPYSSGTTGLPKGVQITHYNLVSQILQVGHPDNKDPSLSIDQPDPFRTIMAIAPFYHAYGIVVMLTIGIAGGAKLIILPKFEPHLFLDSIQKYKIKFVPLSPPLAVFLAKSPVVDNYDLSSLEKITSGAAPLAKDTEDQCLRRLKLNEIKQGYGMTETTAVAMIPALKGQKSGSVGLLAANSEALVVDPETGKQLGANQRGEIWVRGPQIMKGYLNRPQATEETLDKDGYIHTGDIGYYDNDGFFFIVDRIKELIKVKGLQVAPAELEALLLSNNEIADAAVIGIPDDRSGELPRAYVVRRDGSRITEDDIKKFIAGTVARHKWLDGGVEFLQQVPKSENGKILRRLLKSDYLKKTKSRL